MIFQKPTLLSESRSLIAEHWLPVSVVDGNRVSQIKTTLTLLANFSDSYGHSLGGTTCWDNNEGDRISGVHRAKASSADSLIRLAYDSAQIRGAVGVDLSLCGWVKFFQS